MILIGIENQNVTFEQAIQKQYEIIQIMSKHGFITHIRSGKKEYINVNQITKDFLKQVLAKGVKSVLENPKDLDSSRIGYDLWLYPKYFGKSGSLSIRIGTPKICGIDNISISEHSSIISDIYQEVMPIYYEMLLDLISFINPIYAVCIDYGLKNKLNLDEFEYGFSYGFIMYKEGNGLKVLKNSKLAKLEKFGEGYIWKANFSSYENGISSVIDVWKPKLL